MEVSIPDAFFDQPFPEIEVEFDEKDFAKPSVSVRVQETKERILEQIQSLLDQLSRRRREYVEDEIREQNRAVWVVLWGDSQKRKWKKNIQEVRVSELAKALEWLLEQVEEEPELPLEYQNGR